MRLLAHNRKDAFCSALEINDVFKLVVALLWKLTLAKFLTFSLLTYALSGRGACCLREACVRLPFLFLESEIQAGGEINFSRRDLM